MLTVNGSNFASAAQVLWNGAARSTSFVSSSQVTAQISAADVATAGNPTVAVQSGSTTSTSVAFTISALPAPTVTSLSPSSALVGSGALTLTVNGTNFVSGSQVLWNSGTRATTFVSATQLTAQITAADIASAGSALVSVQNAGSTSGTGVFNVNNPVPMLASATPSTILTGAGGVVLTLNGSGFLSNSVVNVNGGGRPATLVSPTQLTAQLTAADTATTGTLGVTVTNAGPGGGTTASVNVTVQNPAPVLSSLSPATAQVGGAAFLLGANGSGFVQGSQILWNGTARATAFVSSTQLTAQITAADVASAGSATVTVLTPSPGGGSSAGLAFSIGNPLPVLAAIAPTNVVAGGSAFPLTVTGSGFVASSSVLVNGSARATTFISSGGLSAQVTATDIASAGSASITVTTPGPGGGTSGTQNLVIQQSANPVPVLSGLTPGTTDAGSPAFVVTLSGSNFVQGSTVLWNGSPRPTTFLTSSNLTAQISAADVATVGSANVAVASPTPGGGTSNVLTFNIPAPPNPLPALASLSPASAGANSGAFTLTVNGSAFVSGSQVLWNGSARVTTFVSNTQLRASILASDIATQGSVPVTVTSPSPGGGTSNSLPFSVGPQVNAIPVITSLTPPSAAITTSSLTIAINGTGFLSNSSVQLNGYTAYGSYTYVNSGQINLTLSSSFMGTVQTLPITVTNPAPGGGISLPVPFNVTAPVNPKLDMITVNINANDLAWDAVHQTFYASTPSTGKPAGNSIVPISTTGVLGTPVYAGSEPNTLGISDDDSKLYTMLTGSLSIQRFNLPSLSNDITISIQQTPVSSFGPYKPLGLAVAPGAANTVAVLRGDPVFGDGNAIIYDDANPRALAQKQSTYGFPSIKDSLVWGKDATKLYEAGQTFNYLSVLTVDSSGIESQTNYNNAYSAYGSGIHFDSGTGYVYDNQGHVTDPATGLPIGVFSASGVMTTDSNLNVAYFVGSSSPFGSNYTLAAFDLRHFTPIATTTLYGITGVPTRLIRFGANGLALVTGPSVYYPSQGSSQVYLLSGPFVTKPSVIPNPMEGGVAMPQNMWDIAPVGWLPASIAVPNR